MIFYFFQKEMLKIKIKFFAMPMPMPMPRFPNGHFRPTFPSHKDQSINLHFKSIEINWLVFMQLDYCSCEKNLLYQILILYHLEHFSNYRIAWKYRTTNPDCLRFLAKYFAKHGSVALVQERELISEKLELVIWSERKRFIF